MAESSWLKLIYNIVVRMPERFELQDLDAHLETLRRAYPKNKNVAAKVRQTLQRLRDQQVIVFLGSGTYRRIVPRPAPTLDIDFSVAEALTSASQRARVALETWAKLNLWCHSCGGPTLLALPPNTPVADLRCAGCGIEYQVKSQKHRFKGRILGAAFEPARKRSVDGLMPDYLLIEYDVNRARVIAVDLIRGHEITEEHLLKRKATSGTAVRPNWVGCEIDTKRLMKIPIVEAAFVPRV